MISAKGKDVMGQSAKRGLALACCAGLWLAAGLAGGLVVGDVQAAERCGQPYAADRATEDTPRVLRNGEQTEITIASPRHDPSHPNWWQDIALLVHSLSEGDRSAFLAAAKQTADGNPAVLMTAEGSVTNELWSRMVHMGYMEAVPDGLPADAPEELRKTMSAHRITPYGLQTGLLFMLAQQAQMNESGGDPSAPGDYARIFAGHAPFHRALPVEHLITLRKILGIPNHESEVGDRPGASNLYKAYARDGIVEAVRPGVWKTTQISVLNSPFLLDIILCEKNAAK